MANNFDNVNHPKHYEGGTSLECIDTMLICFGVEETMTFCAINAYKYLWRYKLKNGIEDLKKSKWYIEEFVMLCVDYNVSHKLTTKITQMNRMVEDRLKKLQNIMEEAMEGNDGSNR